MFGSRSSLESSGMDLPCDVKWNLFILQYVNISASDIEFLRKNTIAYECECCLRLRSSIRVKSHLMFRLCSSLVQELKSPAAESPDSIVNGI